MEAIPCVSTMASSVVIELITMGGDEIRVNLAQGELVRDGKLAAASWLGHPEELQRWVHGMDILDDTYELVEDMQVFCTLLPHCLDLNVKIIRFTPGAEATCAREVSVALPPTLTIDAVKEEIALRCDIRGSCSKMRLVCRGLHLDDNTDLSQYHIDAGATLHLIVPHDVDADQTPQASLGEASSVRIRDLGQGEAMQRASLAGAAAAAVARGVRGECNVGRASSSCSRGCKDDVITKDGSDLCQSLGRSHLQRCRSLSELRRKGGDDDSSSTSSRPGACEVQPMRPSGRREGPVRPRPVRGTQIVMPSSHSGNATARTSAQLPSATAEERTVEAALSSSTAVSSSGSKPPRMPRKAWVDSS